MGKEGVAMSKWMIALRWILVAPGGILAAFLVSFPIHWFVMVTFGGWGMGYGIHIGDPETLESIEWWLQAFFGPLAFVYCAARIAPSHRKVVSVVAAVLLVVAAPVMIANTYAQFHSVEFRLSRYLLQVGGAVVAIIWIGMHERDNYES